jgi:amino acid adenylation domain-containing protein
MADTNALIGGVPADGTNAPATRQIVARLWAEVLQRQDIAPDDHFLDLGGHSLKAMRIIARLEETLGMTLPLERVFQAPTVAKLADLIDELQRQRDVGPEDERRRLRQQWQSNRRAVSSELTLHELFERQAARTPEARAVEFAGRSMTYGELDARANRLARMLMGRGVGRETPVAICMERSLELPVAMLAVLKAGGAYVPVDPDQPADRIAWLVADVAAPVVVTHTAAERRLPSVGPAKIRLDADAPAIEAMSDAPVRGAVGPGNLAYVIHTSGTTGRPKGVMIEHRSIVNHMQWMAQTFGWRTEDRFLQKTPITADASVWEFYAPLLCGATLVVAEPGVHRQPADLARLIARERITVAQFVPTLLAALVAEPGMGECVGLRQVFAGGETLDDALVDRLLARLPVRVHNLYGPTECTIDATWWSHEPGSNGAVSIGRPVWNSAAYVLDGDLQPVAPGQAGELFIGGVCVGRGYWNRPELTAERFVPDPFSPEPGWRMYRTGDLARLRPDGNLECLGRADHQIKLRGFRIEPAEIEAALSRHPAVRRSVVVLGAGAGQERFLAAYVAHDPAAAPSPAELRDHLKGLLPEHMIPAAYVAMERLPELPNGKINRAALPEPRPADRARAADRVAPRTAEEIALAEIWRQVLGVGEVAVDDHFMDLGGHSLLAAQLVWRVRQSMGIDLPLGAIFEAPTLGQLARLLPSCRRVEPEAAPAQPTPAQALAVAPMSFAQRRLWLLSALESDPAVYNICQQIDLAGPLDAARLERAFNAVIARHEALRTTFGMSDGQPVQRIAPSLSLTIPIEFAASDHQADQLAAQEARFAFDLAVGPLIRARLLRLAPDRHRLLLTMHHVVSDGWSMGLLLRELSEFYRADLEGRIADLPALPMQYAQFTHRQHERVDRGEMARAIDYWTRQLAGAPPLLELPTDRPRPSRPSHRGDVVESRWPDALVEQIADLARRHDVTSFMILAAAYAELLRRHTGCEDLVIGMPTAGRDGVSTERLIGFFVNALPLRLDLSGDPTVPQLLDRVKQAVLEALANQELPFDLLVQAVRPPRDASHAPIFQIMIVLQNTPPAALDLPQIAACARFVHTRTAKYDLTLTLDPVSGGMDASLEFATDLFDSATARRLFDQFRLLVEGMVSQPEARCSDLPAMSDAQRELTLVRWNQTAADYPRRATIHEVFHHRAAAAPDAVAMRFGDRMMTYRQLDERSDRLARRLVDAGVKPGRAVAITAERSPEMVVGLLAILKAGGAYLPIDPEYPPQRQALMLGDTQAAALLTSLALADRFGDHSVVTLPLDAPELEHAADSSASLPQLPPDAPAYILFTSGSTGRPKAVAVPHRAVLRLVLGADYAVFTPDRVFLHHSPLAFDASTFEIWGPLLNGACCVVAPPGPLSFAQLGRLIADHRVTTAWLTAALYNTIVDHAPRLLRPLRELLIGGEALSVPHVLKGLADLPDTRLINGYGPTETTTFACCHPIPRTLDPRSTSIPIGAPIANTRVYVLDPRGRPVPIGVPGELHIGGDGVALGYLLQPELTAERFIPDPFSSDPASRLYRTGDLVRWRSDGTLEFLGRLDQQLKIRGFRIEPGEIEAALAVHPAVRQAVVVAREDTPGDKRLVAYLVGPDPAALPNGDELRLFLRRSLPEHMIPQAFVPLPRLPRTATDKIDRRALPVPGSLRPAACVRLVVQPRSDSERKLADIWKQAMNLDSIGVDDDFFELGGHSLLAVRISHEVERVFNVVLPLSVVFESPTIARMAASIERLRRGARVDRLVTLQPRGTPPPVFFLPGVGGHVLNLRALASLLGDDQPVHGLQPLGLDGRVEPDRSIPDMARSMIESMLAVEPQGPYHMAGFSAGGVLAWEIARQLRESGRTIAMLAMLDSYGPNYPRVAPLPMRLLEHARRAVRQGPGSAMMYVARRVGYRVARRLGRRRAGSLALPQGRSAVAESIRRVTLAWIEALQHYQPAPAPLAVEVFRAAQTPDKVGAHYDDPTMGWAAVAVGGARVHYVTGCHQLMLQPPHVQTLGQQLRLCLREHQAKHPRRSAGAP